MSSSSHLPGLPDKGVTFIRSGVVEGRCCVKSPASGLRWQKKEGKEKLASFTRGGRDRNLFCKGELISYDIMLVMMDVTPL
jgi:hypothetical protein